MWLLEIELRSSASSLLSCISSCHHAPSSLFKWLHLLKECTNVQYYITWYLKLSKGSCKIRFGKQYCVMLWFSCKNAAQRLMCPNTWYPLVMAFWEVVETLADGEWLVGGGCRRNGPWGIQPAAFLGWDLPVSWSIERWTGYCSLLSPRSYFPHHASPDRVVCELWARNQINPLFPYSFFVRRSDSNEKTKLK